MRSIAVMVPRTFLPLTMVRILAGHCRRQGPRKDSLYHFGRTVIVQNNAIRVLEYPSYIGANDGLSPPVF